MTAIELLGQTITTEPPEAPAEGVCCVTGQVGPTVGRAHAIKPSFTNLDFLAAPDSERVGVVAWRALTEPAQRKSSWLCSSLGFEKLARLDVRALVLNGVPRDREPWAGYATTSYKKHGALRAPVNRLGSQRWLFELDIVDCSDREMVAEYWEWLRTTREAGIPRPVIETLDIGIHLMRKHAGTWPTFERWARPRMRSSLYRFLTYLLPGKEELGA